MVSMLNWQNLGLTIRPKCRQAWWIASFSRSISYTLLKPSPFWGLFLTSHSFLPPAQRDNAKQNTQHSLFSLLSLSLSLSRAEAEWLLCSAEPWQNLPFLPAQSLLHPLSRPQTPNGLPPSEALFCRRKMASEGASLVPPGWRGSSSKGTTTGLLCGAMLPLLRKKRPLMPLVKNLSTKPRCVLFQFIKCFAFLHLVKISISLSPHLEYWLVIENGTFSC